MDYIVNTDSISRKRSFFKVYKSKHLPVRAIPRTGAMKQLKTKVLILKKEYKIEDDISEIINSKRSKTDDVIAME